MKKSDFTIRTAHSNEDCLRLEKLFNSVFHPEQVGKLASTLFHHHPESSPSFWYMAEHQPSGELAAAFTLIPWHWTWFGKRIKVAEQGLVATAPKYQGLGLQTLLNAAFDNTLAEQAYDLAIIQGIPGFYHKFGYYYSLPIDNHVNLEWRLIPESKNARLNFRKATESDISFLNSQEKLAAITFDSTNTRDDATWRYILTHSNDTEYGSDIWIGEEQGRPKIYCRRNFMGFGEGMIVSEASEALSHSQAIDLFNFLKQQNESLNKPYLRLNLSNDASLSLKAFELGAAVGEPYGFQIKIPNHEQWLAKQSDLFTERVKTSSLRDVSGVFRLDLFQQAIDIQFLGGECQQVTVASANAEKPIASACIPKDLAPALFLGRHTWRELNATRPDLFGHSSVARELLDILFPKVSSWHPLPY